MSMVFCSSWNQRKLKHGKLRLLQQRKKLQVQPFCWKKNTRRTKQTITGICCKHTALSTSWDSSVVKISRGWRGPPTMEGWKEPRQKCTETNKITVPQIVDIATLQGINISHLRKRKIIFTMPFWGDMLVPWRVSLSNFFSRPSHPTRETLSTHILHMFCQHPAEVSSLIFMTASKRQLGCWQQTATG